MLFYFMYETIKQFYSSKDWQRCRASYRKYKKGLCERCLAKGLLVPGEQVHHKKHLTTANVNDPAISLNFENLELLCVKCHAEEHGRRRYKVDRQTGAVTPL